MSVVTSEELRQRQNPDGSFGQQATPTGRVVTTIFAARSLQEAGLVDHPSLGPALDFLARTATCGGCTITGQRDGVLSCYTGMLARLMVRSRRLDDAVPLLEWIVTYQPVVYGDTTYHQPTGPIWGEYLRHRYGGCMAATTCLLGLVPACGALLDARDAGIDVPVDAHLDAMRRLLIDRRLMHRTDGTIIALSGHTKADPHGTRWMLPAFPRDYLIDLIELVDLAQRLHVPDSAMTEAVDLIASWQLPDGSWPTLASRRVADAYRPDPVNRHRASAITTARVHSLGLDLNDR